MRFDTLAQHGGYDPKEHRGHRSEPIYVGVAPVQPDSETARRVFVGEEEGIIYPRFGTENSRMVEKRLALLEGGEAAETFATGLAAINCMLFALTKPKDIVVVQERIYGGTTQSLKVFFSDRRVIFVKDMNDLDELSQKTKGLRPKFVFTEILSNPTLDVLDVKKLAEFSRRNKAKLVVDSTFATPVLSRPLEFGADIIIHSTTKFINIENMGGIVIGQKSDVQMVHEAAKFYGATCSQYDLKETLKGIRFLPIKVRRQSETALEIARFLSRHRAIKQVYYPGLPNSRNYYLAKKYLPDDCGGMLAFETHGTGKDTKNFIDTLALISNVVNLGSTWSNVTYPQETTHSILDPETRLSSGIRETFVRFSTGLEDADDLLEDLDQALRKISN